MPTFDWKFYSWKRETRWNVEEGRPTTFRLWSFNKRLHDQWTCSLPFFFGVTIIITWIGEWPMVLWLLKNRWLCSQEMMIRRVSLLFSIRILCFTMCYAHCPVSSIVKIPNLTDCAAVQRTHTHILRMEQWYSKCNGIMCLFEDILPIM